MQLSDLTFQLIAIGIYFAAMIWIGYYAYRRTTDHSDYMLAGRKLPPWAAGLSAGASDMSGWLMMGLPGALYVSGMIEAWIAVGLTIGAYLNWRLVAPRLRAYSEVSSNAITIPSFLGNRFHSGARSLRIATSVIILVYFTFYVSSGMVAGGVFFQESFNSTYVFGAILIAGITLLYTMMGGFLGTSLTDVVQGSMMMLALLIVPLIATVQLGGPGEVVDAVRSLEPDHFSLTGGSALTGAVVISIISALAWGLGYFGQPHIIIRFMAMEKPGSATAARRIGMSWMIASLLGALASGFVGLAYFNAIGVELGDPEAVVLAMSQLLLHPLIAGFILAAVLAAIMSTVSSQLIVCSSALVEDIYLLFAKKRPSNRALLMLGRFGVLAVAVIAMVLALSAEGTILSLVAFAWAGFGASFGPTILLSLFWRRLTYQGALAGMIAGAITVFVWGQFLDSPLYEIVPGFALNVILAVVVSKFTYKPNPKVDEEFTAAVAMARGDVAEEEEPATPAS